MIGRVNEVDTTQHQLAALTSKLDKLMTKGPSVGVICGICSIEGHLTDACPTLQEGNVNAMFNQQPRKYDPYSNTYNEGWRDHPNLRYGPPNPPGFARPQPPANQTDKTSFLLEQLIKKMDQDKKETCLLYTSPSPRDGLLSRMPSSA